MKKTYTTPELLRSGNAINDTLVGTISQCESDNPPVNALPCVGSVGYYL